MKAVLSQVGSREPSGRQLKQSRHTIMRTEASHSWEGEDDTADDCPKILIVKFSWPCDINNWPRFHLKAICLQI